MIDISNMPDEDTIRDYLAGIEADDYLATIEAHQEQNI